MIRFWRRWTRPNLVSADWLQNQQRRESRIEFHGVNIKFPIKKMINESPAMNRQRLKRRA